MDVSVTFVIFDYHGWVTDSGRVEASNLGHRIAILMTLWRALEWSQSRGRPWLTIRNSTGALVHFLSPVHTTKKGGARPPERSDPMHYCVYHKEKEKEVPLMTRPLWSSLRGGDAAKDEPHVFLGNEGHDVAGRGGVPHEVAGFDGDGRPA